MKSYITILLALSVFSLKAQQQNILTQISNSYLVGSNELQTEQAIQTYRTIAGLPYIQETQEEMLSNVAYFKISYPPAANEPGLMSILYKANSESKYTTIEDILNRQYRALLLDDDEDNYTKDVEKTAVAHGGFFFNENHNTIDIFILSQPNLDFVWATVEINNLTVAEKEAFARDFIQKMAFN